MANNNKICQVLPLLYYVLEYIPSLQPGCEGDIWPLSLKVYFKLESEISELKPARVFLGEWKHKKNLRWKVQEKQENSKMVELMLSFSKYTKHVHWTRGLGMSNWVSYVLSNFWTSSEFSAIMYLAEMLSMLLICVYAFSKPYAWCLKRKH